MVYKTVSINNLIAKLYRDLKPSNSGWVQDAIEWIGEAIDYMKCGGSYGEQSKTVEVIDYRAKLPCDLECLLGVSYNGRRLPRNGGFILKNLKSSCVNLLPTDGQESYILDPNYIHTSFKEGCVTFYYLGMILDCDGYPEIIDNTKVKDAIEWYVLMKMLGRGFKHQVFTYQDAEQRWIVAYPKAQNACKMPDLDGYQLFKKVWLGAVNANDLASVFYRNSEGLIVNNDTFDPGSQLATIDLIGVNSNNPSGTSEEAIDPDTINVTLGE